MSCLSLFIAVSITNFQYVAFKLVLHALFAGLNILHFQRKPVCNAYKGSARRAASVGAERRGPWFGATSDLTLPRACSADLILALCCCVLVGDVTF